MRLQHEIERRLKQDPKSDWASAERQLVRPASAIEDEGRLSFYEWQELQGLREREKDHAAEIQRLQKRLEEAEGPQHLKVENLKKELDLTDKLFVERNQHCRKVELEKANVAATLKSKEKEVKDLREELGVATEEVQAAQRRLAEKEKESKALQRKCERLERSLKETVVLESCGQQQSKIYRSQSGGMLAEKMHQIRLHW